MYRKLVFVLTMLAVAFGSLSQVQAALASSRPAAPVASAAHAGTRASIAAHSATGAVRPAAATRPMAHGAGLRTEERQVSLPLSTDRRATGTASAPTNTIVIAPPSFTSAASTIFTVGQPGSFGITTYGSIPMSLSVTSGNLPSGVTFTGGNGTATLAGTPAAGTTGTYTFTITASNLVPPNTATQTFTLTVVQQCKIISSAGTTFTVGQAGTFAVTTTGTQPCGFSVTSGSLPSGVALTDNKDGTATLSGTPAAGTGGSHQFTITATNGGTPYSQPFTLTVNEACKITSANTYNFAAGTPGQTPAVTSTGTPTCTYSETPVSPTTLPSWLTWNSGTATFSGTPPTGTVATYTFTITASNVVGYDTQTFTLTVGGAVCTINHTAATIVPGGTFTVTTTGPPTCSLSATGLPTGVTFIDNGNGTGTISAASSVAPNTYNFTITATNVIGSFAPLFTLTVVAAGTGTPCVLSNGNPASATYTVGQPGGSLTFTSTGPPTCALSATGLPAGVTLTDNGDGTATLSGTPAAGTGGTYLGTITAKNGDSPNATQAFTLYVLQACQIISPAGTTFTVGHAGNFTVTSTGVPTCGLSVTGLPSGVTFKDNGDGTATLSQAPPVTAAAGPHTFTITATNGVGPATTQTFTLTVNQACQITSADHANLTVGQAGTFTVTSTGTPTCGLSETGKLPSGVTFTDNGDGTATLSGTPAPRTGGTYLFTIIATNSVGSDTQPFTLTVLQAPGITSADHTTCTVGKACAFTVRSTGVPTPNLSESGNLPSGVLFTDNGNGRAALSGMPAAGTGGTYKFTITATNVVGSYTQHFTLSVVGLPAAPSGLKATGKGKTVSLTWKNNASAPSAATGILIQRSANAGFTAGIINTTVGPTVTTHIDTAVVKGKRYYYRVRASNAAGNSAWSNVSNVTAP